MLEIPDNPAVINEPIYSNRRATIAMAKLPDKPNSATNEWFFNLADNSGGNASLDSQNSGFTVFGEVIGNGMGIIDSMALIARFNFTSMSNVPLRNFTTTDAKNGVKPTDLNFIMILNVVVLDANIDTAANLTPAKTTYTPPVGGGSSDGGGSMSWLSLLMLLCIAAFGRSRR